MNKVTDKLKKGIHRLSNKRKQNYKITVGFILKYKQHSFSSPGHH
jgi:hypothetical protein